MQAGRILSTIRGRIVLVYSILFVIGFAAIMLMVSERMGGFLISQRTQTQQVQVEAISTRIAPYVFSLDMENIDRVAQDSSRDLSGRVVVMDTDGIVMADSHARLNGRALRHREVEDVRSGAKPLSYGFHFVENADEDGGLFSGGRVWAVYYTTPIVSQSRNVGILLISLPIQDLISLVDRTITQFTLITLFILAIMVGASLFVSRWISQPIQQMTGAIRKMSRGDFETRVHVTGATEMTQMAATFNMMSERLANLDTMRNEFVANASHELKTPLSTIKILTESLLYQEDVPEDVYKEFLADINAQIDRLNTLLNDLLALTQADQEESALSLEDVEVDALMEETLYSLEPLAERYEVKLVQQSSGVVFKADKGLLSSALFNLVSNGIKYSQSGGSVTVRAEADEQEVRIYVVDTGIGIPQKDLVHIFERFYRVDKARSRDTGGTGLGLAIVQQVCRLHGGDVRVYSRENEGSTFVMILPRKGAQA